ncbi:GNAT family N-acetyltransferase [Lysinibacillus sp. 38-6]|uniref:GNAT family N-acetyltransferase n=1 Tax=Lysinibacillus sp. 38-6 TaxID=3385991 RepID=UPI003908AA2C
MQIIMATRNEVPQIEILYQELFIEMSKLQPNYIQAARQDVAFIRHTIQNQASDILLAKVHNEIVGFLLIQEMTTPPYACIVKHKYAFIVDIIVGSQYQSQGIGSALLSEAKKWAENRQLDYLELNVLAENGGAFTLYEKQGFQVMNHTMRLELA